MTTEDTNVTAASQNNDLLNITDTVTPPPEFVSENNEEPTNNEVRTAATSSENFTIPASAVEPAPTSVNCRCFPHGVYAIIPALFSTMAWFACLSKDACDYARVTGPIVGDITNDPSTPYIDAGFTHYRAPTLNTSGKWVLDLTLPCEAYNTDIVPMDGVWGFAKTTSFLSLVFGGGGALFIWFASCFVFRKNTWRWAGYELLVAVILQALTYSWFATSLCHENDGNCAMNYGARADILACVLWAASVLCIFCKYPSEKIRSTQASNSFQQPPAEVEMSNQSGEWRSGAAMDENEII
eukprot:CAMPEP_0201868492 /NCGR_PEP_ID=MMETSP0902-20130614/2350_1 /ASSEMBLY_ACC=CAM_ASM_000551 /TAXON_ID=420261 /ORGANISM="Thalassiosira antarctica, Strain CCMP982" /LENGTH=296 /DNA_ID=CAMNT_0048393839 /DNA_START=46 /DNA_END=936 /DNA_ORIENTATION=-